MRRTPGASWDGFVDKEPVREALARDQGRLCAYCEQRLPTPFRIEHWHARASGGAEFGWTNLLGVCNGNAGLGALHCDAARGVVRLFLHPVEGRGRPDPREWLRWLGNGEVESDHPDAARDIVTLCLNHPKLVRQRLEVLNALRSRREAGNGFAGMLRRLDIGDEFRETRRYWLERHLAR